MSDQAPAGGSPLLQLRPPNPRPTPCKVCGGTSKPFGATDFNRACNDKPFAPRGVVVPYRRCEACGLVFTEAFDDWSLADFEAHIYNDAYAEVDPEYEVIRPVANAHMIADAFSDQAMRPSVLDYGGGNGRLALDLRQAGFATAETYDPLDTGHRVRPERKFQLVTCFETLEHMPDPTAGATDILSFLEDDGLIIFSTLIQPGDFARQGMAWWYIGPRNGHITFYTLVSLGVLWGRLGLKVVSFNDNLHAAFRTVPPFAKHLIS